MSGPEVQANIIHTALHGLPLRSAWNGWTFVLIVLFALIAPVARLWLRTWQALLIALGAGVLYVVVAQLVFDQGRILVVTYPLFALAVSCIGVLVAELRRGTPGDRHEHMCGPPGRRAS